MMSIQVVEGIFQPFSFEIFLFRSAAPRDALPTVNEAKNKKNSIPTMSSGPISPWNNSAMGWRITAAIPKNTGFRGAIYPAMAEEIHIKGKPKV